MSYLKSFIIGSSLPTVLMFYFLFFSIPDSIKNYSNEQYALVAPLYFGFMNMLSLFVGNLIGLKLRSRLLMISIISIIYILASVKLNNVYKFENTFQWISYGTIIVIFHLMAYNVIIYSLEEYM
jgi:hypothetical protein